MYISIFWMCIYIYTYIYICIPILCFMFVCVILTKHIIIVSSDMHRCAQWNTNMRGLVGRQSSQQPVLVGFSDESNTKVHIWIRQPLNYTVDHPSSKWHQQFFSKMWYTASNLMSGEFSSRASTCHIKHVYLSIHLLFVDVFWSVFVQLEL